MPTSIACSHRLRIAAPADECFLFFTPAGEVHWAEGWVPRYVAPTHGRAQAGMVFTTGAGAEFTIWMLADFDRTARRARYARVTPALRTGFVEIACDPVSAQESEVLVTYRLTALSREGADSLDAFAPAAYARMIEGWKTAIDARLPVLRAGVTDF